MMPATRAASRAALGIISILLLLLLAASTTHAAPPRELAAAGVSEAPTTVAAMTCPVSSADFCAGVPPGLHADPCDITCIIYFQVGRGGGVPSSAGETLSQKSYVCVWWCE